MTTTILITGVDHLLGTQVAWLLSNHPDVHLIGLGTRPLPELAGRARIITDTLDASRMITMLRDEQVDVVIHLDIAGEEQPAHNREETLQHNVLDSMGLLGACATAGVRRVVVRSSTLVYGATLTTPLLVGEDHMFARARHGGLIHDYIELEQFATTFATSHPDTCIVMLRCASLVGSEGWSPLANYLSQSAPPVLLGFDPRIQVLHREDAATAFALAAISNGTGAFNLASEGVVTLNQAIRLAGHQPALVPEPVVAMASHLLPIRFLLKDWPYDRGFLRYSCVADTRRARRVLGWSPLHSAEETLRGLRERDSTTQAQKGSPLHALFGKRGERTR